MEIRFVGHFFRNQESRELLIFSTQCQRVLIFSPSQKDCETNPCREQKNAAGFANGIIWRKITITWLREVTAWALQTYITKENNPSSECY